MGMPGKSGDRVPLIPGKGGYWIPPLLIPVEEDYWVHAHPVLGGRGTRYRVTGTAWYPVRRVIGNNSAISGRGVTRYRGHSGKSTVFRQMLVNLIFFN